MMDLIWINKILVEEPIIFIFNEVVLEIKKQKPFIKIIINYNNLIIVVIWRFGYWQFDIVYKVQFLKVAYAMFNPK